MHQMWKMKKMINNKGVAVVETSIIVPIFLLILFSFIILYLRMLDIAIIQGNAYASIFSMKPEEVEEQFIDKLIMSIDENSVLENSIDIKGNDYGDMYEWVIKVKGFNGSGIITKDNEEVIRFTKENNNTSDRLRRWQMYGDFYNDTGDK